MKYLIYEQFSGVGFCNQLFSLETAIYLANITDRKLILLIRFPLCHCGASSWDYGRFLDFFDDQYKKYLPHNMEVYYGEVPEHVSKIIKNQTLCETISFPNVLSQIGLVDKELDTHENEPKIRAFLNHRAKKVIDFSSYSNDYIYINKSNAARCFYNFYTTDANYTIMSKICEALTHLNPSFYYAYNNMKLPKNYISVHFRFGDRKHRKREIDTHSNRFREPLFKLLGELNTTKLPIVVMCDRMDAELLVRLKSNFNVIYTDDIIKDIDLNANFANFKRTELLEFLLQKMICFNADTFIGHDGSTVSNYINYIQYLNNKPYYYYLDKVLKYDYSEYTWKLNGFVGGNISFRVFFADNIIKNTAKLITLTNDGYSPFTENLLLSMKKLGIENKLKIYCIGDKCYNHFREKYTHNEIEQIEPPDEYLKEWLGYKSAQNPDAEGKMKWANITSYKMYAIHNELIQDNDVMFTDGDIVFEKDPIPYLTENIKDLDLLIQNDNDSYQRRAMCTGVFYMKSNDLTKEITDFSIIQQHIDSFTNDQQYLRRHEKRMKVEYLDLDLFPNGLYYREKKPSAPILIHFNYDVSEQKITRMKAYNKWYLDESVQIVPPKLTSSAGSVKNSSYRPPLRTVENIRMDLPLSKYIETQGIKLRQGHICQIQKHETAIIASIHNANTISNILEIGFLAGHSADMFLKINDTVKVTSIDMCAFQSVQCGKKYIDQHYPARHTLVRGESSEILPSFIQSTTEKFDIILIDGSYEEKTVLSDIILCRAIATENTLLIINNVLKNNNWIKYWNKGPTQVYNDLVRDKKLKPIKNIDIDIGRGSVVCKYC